jgi:GNAT superfamily N-acetyltransferase
MSLVAVRSTTITQEPIADVVEAIQPLLRAHWEEIASYPDIPLEVNLAFYRQLEREGRLVIMTARDPEAHLVGYAIFFLNQHPHYATSRQAVLDVFFVESTRRGAMLGVRLLAAAEARLRDLDCQAVYQHVKLAHPALGSLLRHRGYTALETIYGKRLDRE